MKFPVVGTVTAASVIPKLHEKIVKDMPSARAAIHHLLDTKSLLRLKQALKSPSVRNTSAPVKRNSRAIELAVRGFRALLGTGKERGEGGRGGEFISLSINMPDCALRCKLFRDDVPGTSSFALMNARGRARRYKLLRDGEQILVETSERKWGREEVG